MYDKEKIKDKKYKHPFLLMIAIESWKATDFITLIYNTWSHFFRSIMARAIPHKVVSKNTQLLLHNIF